jgi:hypothetical protein
MGAAGSVGAELKMAAGPLLVLVPAAARLDSNRFAAEEDRRSHTWRIFSSPSSAMAIMELSESSRHNTRTAPARASVSICRSLPQDVALRMIQQASVRTPTSVAGSVQSAMTRSRQPLSNTAWICGMEPAAMLDSVHAASFWMVVAPWSMRARSSGTAPKATQAPVKSLSSSAQTMLPTARSAGLHTRTTSWRSRRSSLEPVEGSSGRAG